MVMLVMLIVPMTGPPPAKQNEKRLNEKLNECETDPYFL